MDAKITIESDNKKCIVDIEDNSSSLEMTFSFQPAIDKDDNSLFGSLVMLIASALKGE